MSSQSFAILQLITEVTNSDSDSLQRLSEAIEKVSRGALFLKVDLYVAYRQIRFFEKGVSKTPTYTI